METVPEWMAVLDEEDMQFIKKFILASGSLKEIATQYNVSYPTVRLRLDKLIQKIGIQEKEDADQYVSLIKRLALDEKMDFDTAKKLIRAYKERLERIKS